MPLHEVVGREVKANRRFKVFQLLAEGERQRIEALHVEACRGGQALHVGRGNARHVGLSHHDVLLDSDDFRCAVTSFRCDGFDGSIGFDN